MTEDMKWTRDFLHCPYDLTDSVSASMRPLPAKVAHLTKIPQGNPYIDKGE